MTKGEQLIIACLKKGDTKMLSSIQKKWLEGSELRQYMFVMDYYRAEGELVGLKTFCSKFKLDASEADSSPSYYLSEIRDRYIYASLSDNIPRLLKGVKDDPKERLADIQKLIAGLALDAEDRADVLYSEEVDSRKADYLERESSKGVTYLSMGSADMDSVFYGYRKHDLITIGGKAGQGKTWVLVFLMFLLEQVLKDSEKDFGEILFMSNEMGGDEIKERLDAIKFKLPYSDFLQGTLDPKLKSKYFKGLKVLSKAKSNIRIIEYCQTIDDLATYIGLYKPAVVFIDGSYLMEGKMAEGWEKIVYVTRNLKRLAKTFGVPIINTTQLKRGTGKGGSKHHLDGQDDFAYSSSYSQDSDIAIRMFQDADMKYHDLVGMEVVKGRRVVAGTTLMFQNDLEKMNLSITLPADESKTPEFKTDY